MRTAFINELVLQARANRRIFLIVGDLGFSVVEPFAKEFPDRFINAGVAEQNMTGMAAGLASEGYHVFTYSIANFPTFRCAEQIRNDVAYHNLPVTVVSVGGGFSYGSLGYSHHAVQDLALMRSFPGMVVAAPGDPVETRAVLRELCMHPRPSYLRLGKAGEPVVHPTELAEISEGEVITLPRKSTRTSQLLLTTGATLKVAHDAWATLPEDGWTLGSIPLWGEESKNVIARQLISYGRILTVEDHLRSGGFASFISEALAESAYSGRLQSVALSPEVCCRVASQSVLNEQGGLSKTAILKKIETL